MAEKNHHKFHLHLPRKKRELALFMLVISIISVNIIAPLVTFADLGTISADIWLHILKVLPILWICVVIFVLITMKPAQILTDKIIHKEDSYNAHIVVNILMSVLLLSIILSVIGVWIGTWNISYEPIEHFFLRWPRNFGISFGVEVVIAQPIARRVMKYYHKAIDKPKQK